MFLAAKNEVVISINRVDVMSGDISKALSTLSVFSESAEAIRGYANSLTILFEGWEQDYRELYEIDEVRTFVQSLSAKWPFWIHFSNKIDHNLLVIMKCLMEIKGTKRNDGVVRSILVDGELSRVIGELFSGMNYIYELRGLSANENSMMTQEFKRYLNSLHIE